MTLRTTLNGVMKMGLMDSLNPFSGGDEDEDDEILMDGTAGRNVDDMIEAPDDSIEDDLSEPEPEPEHEEEPGPWDSAYDFADWWLEDEGFADMTDFGEKAIMYKLQRSPMFRDRIQTGLETLSSVRKAKENLEGIRGNDTSATDYGELADKVEDADRLISGVRSLSGEDEMVVQQGLGLAREAIQAIGNRTAQGTGSVDTETEVVDESIDG